MQVAFPAPGIAPVDRFEDVARARCASRPNRYAWLFPGLGARYVGMGGDLLGRNRAADELVAQASAWLGYDVPAVCLEGSGRKHVPPRHEAQVIYVVDCAYARALQDAGSRPQITAGHSLGSFAAAYAAGVFDFLTGLKLVSCLEDLMEAHLDAAPTAYAMAAIIGLSESKVIDICQGQGATSIANQNSNGQYVVAGPSGEVEAVMADAAAAGAYQIKRLPTSRPMHTPHLEPVSEAFAAKLRDIELNDPQVPFVCGETGALLDSAGEVRDYFSRFVSRPVRWESAMRGLLEQGLADYIEVGPATVLADLMRFIDRTTAVRPASEVLSEVPAR